MVARASLLYGFLLSIFFAPRAFAIDNDAALLCQSESNFSQASIQACSTLLRAGGLSLHQQLVVYLNRGMRYERKDEMDLAISDFQSALSIDATNFDASMHLGILFRRRERYDDSIKAFSVYIRSNPVPSASLHIGGRGITYLLLKDYTAARRDLDAALAVCKKAIAANLASSCPIEEERALADLELVAGDKTKGIQYFTRQISLIKPADGLPATMPLIERGIAYMSMSNWDAAKRDLDQAQRALNARPRNYQEDVEMLGAAQSMLGRHDVPNVLYREPDFRDH